MQRDIKNQTQATITENARMVQEIAGILIRDQNSDQIARERG